MLLIFLLYPVFDDFILAKPLWSLESSVLVINTLWGKLASSLELPVTFDERFKVPSLTFFIPDFNLLNCELGNVTFEVLYWAILN